MFTQKIASRRWLLPPTDKLLPKLIIFMTMHSLSWAEAGSPVLHLPIDCQMGTQCFIQNYVDSDPSPDYGDYTCGFLSYDGHKGTDFRLPDLSMMELGVKVLAAASGQVRAIRDGMPDISIRNIDRSLIEGKEAGNSVAIQHGNGWETQYSHLRKGSVLVQAGDHVEAGQVLGLVGLSGKTEFPHLHFSVRSHGKIIDPFTGQYGSGCEQPEFSLWDTVAAENLQYIPTGILKLAFADQKAVLKPYYEHLNSKDVMPDNAARIILWVHVFGVREGDRHSLQIISPEGEILAVNKETIEVNQAQRLNMIGLRGKHGNPDWALGEYKGIYTLKRPEHDQYITVLNRTIDLQIIPSH
jgi:hypothetical protein